MSPDESRVAAIVGLGMTPQGRHPGRTGNDLAVHALALALDDAGLQKSDIDGLVTCKALMGAPGDGLDMPMGQVLGLDPDYSASLDYGTCNFSVHLAAMVIASGLAHTVALTYGTIQGTMMGDVGFAGRLQPDAVYGMVDGIGFMSAVMFQRHRERYGVTEAQLGAVTVAQRRWAALNPGALRADPITVEDYLAAPYYINPVRSYDIAPFDDGAVALVMTSLERARHLQHRPVSVLGMSQVTALRGPRVPNQLDRDWIVPAADRVFADARLERADIDVVSIQDPSSLWTVQMLEHFGFVGPGEALPFIADGHTGPGGRLPVNTGGGHLAESYMWGWGHTAEVVRQLRGECGERQVPGARHGIHCSTAGPFKAAATIYGASE